MSRYIDAEKLLKALDSYKGTEDTLYYDEIEMYVQDTPTVDVVEVVRCENCVYWDGDGRCNGIKNGLILEYVNGYDYCSYGKRGG